MTRPAALPKSEEPATRERYPSVRVHDVDEIMSSLVSLVSIEWRRRAYIYTWYIIYIYYVGYIYTRYVLSTYLVCANSNAMTSVKLSTEVYVNLFRDRCCDCPGVDIKSAEGGAQ